MPRRIRISRSTFWRTISTLGCVLWIWFPGVPAALQAAVVLVEDGQPKATIVLADRPTRAAQFAAFELQHHLACITGARVPIVRESAEIEGVPILVGSAQAAQALDLSPDDFEPQEYAVRVSSEAVVLRGRDKQDFEKVVYDAADPMCFGTWPDLFDEQATCYAVYDFLELLCGMRWYTPTELGTVCPRQKTLKVRETEIRRRPSFIYRDMGHVMRMAERYNRAANLWPADSPVQAEIESLGYAKLAKRFPDRWRHLHAKRGLNLLFMHRMRLGGSPYRANHSFYGYYDRFWEKNPKQPELFVEHRPEYFAHGYEGKPPQMCYTNQGFIEQVIADARDYFDGKGTKPGAMAFGDFFALVPMDNSAYCKCDACQALMNRDEADSPFFSNGYASDYVFGFTNRVARAIAESHPDKYLATLAYARYAYYPERVRLEPNIAVQMCLHVRNIFDPALQKNDEEFFHSWATKEKDRPLYLWLYYCFPAERGQRLGGWHVFPGFFAHGIDTWFKRFAKHNVRGAFFNGCGQDVETYVSCQLMNDPSQDVDALLDDYFTGYFGPAAEPMKAFYLDVERIYSDPANYPKPEPGEPIGHQTERQAWGWLGTAERMERLARLVEEARGLAIKSPYRERFVLFEREVWDYMRTGPVQTTKIPRDDYPDSPATLTRLLYREPRMNDDDAAQGKPWTLVTEHSYYHWQGKTHGGSRPIAGLTDGDVSDSLFFGGKAEQFAIQCDLDPVPEGGRQLRSLRVCWTLNDGQRSRAQLKLAVRDAASGTWRDITPLFKIDTREHAMDNSYKVLEVPFPAGAVTGFHAVRLIDAAPALGANPTRWTEIDVVTEPERHD